jgi:thiol:disulfide interchange protein DsbD
MSLLFVFAIGMGTLLIIIGTFAGIIAALPKSGAWMKKIKFISGLILIGAAEYFLYITGMLSI